jgi:hypothetical protein
VISDKLTKFEKNDMTYVEIHIVETYSDLFENLSTDSKLDLIERLTKSLKRKKRDKDIDFFKSFGAFGSSKSAEVIAKDIRSSRRFIQKDLSF